tara:strand:+ start:58 stop:837 length:780 start_codon:yes stop_codon:yes gene_type:complete
MKILRNFIDVKGNQVHYRQCGTGHPIILLHMTPGSSMIYEECMKLLAEYDYQVFAIDTPGYGDSDSIGENKTIEDYSEIISEVIKTLRLKKVHLVGLSTGSVIAAAIAIYYSDFIDRLILVEPGIFNTPDRQKRGYHGVKIELDKDGQYFVNRWKQISNGFGGNLTNDQAFVLFLDALRSHKHQHEAYQALIYYDLLNDLPKITVPTLLISGALSTREEPMETFSQKINDSSIAIIENAANAPPLEQPQKFVETVLQWL